MLILFEDIFFKDRGWRIIPNLTLAILGPCRNSVLGIYRDYVGFYLRMPYIFFCSIKRNNIYWSRDNSFLCWGLGLFVGYWVGRFIIFARVAYLVFDGSGLNELFFLPPSLFYDDVSDNGHHNFFTFAAPSSDILWLYFTIAVGAWSLVFQPAINAFVMKIVTTLSHEQRIRIKTNWTDFLRLIFERFGIPK